MNRHIPGSRLQIHNRLVQCLCEFLQEVFEVFAAKDQGFQAPLVQAECVERRLKVLSDPSVQVPAVRYLDLPLRGISSTWEDDGDKALLVSDQKEFSDQLLDGRSDPAEKGVFRDSVFRIWHEGNLLSLKLGP